MASPEREAYPQHKQRWAAVNWIWGSFNYRHLVLGVDIPIVSFGLTRFLSSYDREPLSMDTLSTQFRVKHLK
ncbi:hypothetical protein JTE90_021926 [Oedothorax gibbosus]|uniref:Uncharacterized protein n=1 Tax=Oedothorax gibbosus TaxID=931172 RepID=A0AAV6VUQ0_9ARAC|nr:hypothetical protein JTE90_021926 [Oedothorax gibbosus]